MPLNGSCIVRPLTDDLLEDSGYEYYMPYSSVIRNLVSFSLHPKEAAEIVSLFYLKRKELIGDLRKVSPNSSNWIEFGDRIISPEYNVTSYSDPYFDHDYFILSKYKNLGFNPDDYYPEITKLHPELYYSATFLRHTFGKYNKLGDLALFFDWQINM